MQKKFVELYLNNSKPIDQFWKQLSEKPQFKDYVNNLQTTIQVGIITDNHLPLVNELHRILKVREDGITSVKDLAKLDIDYWRRLIRKQTNGQIISFPPDVPGIDNQQKEINYAKTLVNMLEYAFPTLAVAYRVQNDSARNSEDVRTFFKNIIKMERENENSNFELSYTDVDQYVKDNLFGT